MNLFITFRKSLKVFWFFQLLTAIVYYAMIVLLYVKFPHDDYASTLKIGKMVFIAIVLLPPIFTTGISYIIYNLGVDLFEKNEEQKKTYEETQYPDS